MPLNLDIHHQCAAVLAVAAGFLFGGIFGLLALDGVIMLLIGHEYTISHAMNVLGSTYKIAKLLWLALGFGFTTFFYWHFWGWTF